MPDRSWFLAVNGKQQGPYPEAQVRDFIARGMVTAQTMVWTEGMAGWQKAGEVPELMSYPAGPLGIPRAGGPVMRTTGEIGQAASLNVGVWPLLGRSLLFFIGLVLVIPAPWAATSFYHWIISRISVPGRPNLGFTGQVGDIWYVFVASGLCLYAEVIDNNYLTFVVFVLDAILAWIVVKWIAGNLSSNGKRLPIDFTGGALGYFGWYLLMYISFITIIGWAWVITAWMRWICRNISGTHREVVFNATGLEMLWRTVVFSLGCVVIIPIPWVLSWYFRWYISQFALVERGATG